MDNEQVSLIGQQLGIYQVQASLGEGGMAQVYKAYHPRLRREVAIKVILAEIADSAGFRERFEREAQMIASLEHPNIVSVYDFGEEGHLTYLVMQYVGGGTLRDQLRGKRPLEPQRALRYASQMALALHHAHQRGIVHRDVKPQNMLVSSTDPNHLLLSDFGIAKLYYQKSDDAILAEMPTRDINNSALTSASQIIGTADYMAPEQVNGSAVDARTDVYALGVVLYQMLVGDIPFHSTTLHGLLFQHLYTPPPPVRERNPLVPEILAQITEKALAKSPAERFPSAEALARALEQANAHATHLNSFAAQHPLISGDGGPTMPWTPPVTSPTPARNTPAQWMPPATPSQSNLDEYATRTAPGTGPAGSYTTSAQHLSRTVPGSAITGTPRPRTGRRRFPLSYVLAALVLVICLAVAGLRWLPGLLTTSSSAGNTPGTGSAVLAFHDQFEDNHLNWPTGALAPGVTASVPGNGKYTVTISTNTTVFPYPQNVGPLPDDFTLSTTVRQTSSTADNAFGLAFHFTQNGGSINCYVLAIAGNGTYILYEYTNNTPALIARGNYQAGSQAHTLTVKAHGAQYTFTIDNQPLQLTVGSQSLATWNNNDLHQGHLTLFFTGPNAGEPLTTFNATDVQLSIP